MPDKINAILKKLLTIDLSVTAIRAGFINREAKKVNFEDVCEAISALNDLSLAEDDGTKKAQDARNLFIAIAALLWEHAGGIFCGLSEALIYLLSKIGYSPSSIILDGTFKNDGKYAPLQSLISQFQTELQQRRYEVTIGDKREVLTDFQHKIWRRIVEKHIVGISAPTSSGKSFVLLLAAVNLVISKKMDVIYVVPTVSLINQVTRDFIAAFRKYGCSSYEILNTYNAELIDNKRPTVFILTQERAIAAFTMTETPFTRKSMLIVDEIQNIERANEGDNEMRSKVLLDAIYEFRFIENIEKIIISGPRIREIGKLCKELFGISESEFLDTEISPVLSLTYSVKKRKDGTYILRQYSSVFDVLSCRIDNPSFISGYGKKLYTDGFYAYLSALVHNLGDENQNIIFSPTSIQARKTALALADAANPTPDQQALSNYLKETVHSSYSLADTVLSGVAYHHGKLPLHVRKAVEYAISKKIISNVACTTTLMQGVNMPAQNLIIRNPHLYVRQMPDSTEISRYEMANLRGRAGRLLKDFIGRSYVLEEDSFAEAFEDNSQLSLFDSAYKELDSSYQRVFQENSSGIRTALADQTPSNKVNNSFGYIVTYVRQAILRYGEEAKERLRSIGVPLTNSEFAAYLNSVSALSIPKAICLKNRYWDPIVLNALWSERESLPPFPNSTAEKGAGKKLRELLKFFRDNDQYASFFISKIPERFREGQNLGLLCSKAMQWGLEKPLKTILSDNYFSDPADGADRIENTIKLLQETISYDMPILLKPIADIKNNESLFLTFLEAGAFQPVTRKLIEIGVPRESAIYLFNRYFQGFDTSENIYESIQQTLLKHQREIPLWTRIQLTSLIFVE